MSVKQHMITDVSVLPSRLRVTAAMAKLASNPYGVVVTDAGTPVAVVKGTDLESLQVKGFKTLKHAVKHLDRPLIIGSTTEVTSVADTVLKQIRRQTFGSVRLPQTVVLDKIGVAGILTDTNLIQVIRELPGVEIPKQGKFKGQIRFSRQTPFRELTFGFSAAGGGGGPVGPPPQIDLAGTGRSIRVICAEPGCGYLNTLFRVPKPGGRKPCQNPDPPPHFLRVGR